ncbi:hypothetical protein KVR01_005888 [Diaporthe batatas]|uniref:uncharacterized protein n=1 Tax=Diaporthe batatas TaxID=748121 RepID=UPI001D05BF30|nr:uncharacterized protein KVR01_005888 [Diaporthe batatas]KAG8163970.1 hypothetical protein KVR01_005888 [Diaporthe batatas]
MAPSPVTEDYYAILEVEQTARPELITKSYKRLALKLHPDRNPKRNATEAFQMLGQAYETLKDENTRRAYDLLYPSIIASRNSSQSSQTPHSPTASASQSDAVDATQIAALRKSKQERAARWRSKKGILDASIFEMQRAIRRLQQEIKNLESILAAEDAAERQKNSWTTWLLSPIYKKREDSEEEKACKDRKRQERRIEKDMKERRLSMKSAEMKTEQTLLRMAKEEVDAADLSDDRKIQVIQSRMSFREDRRRQEREKAYMERMANERRQQQETKKREEEAAEALRKKQAEARAAEQRRYEEAERQRIIEENLRRNRQHTTYSDFARGSTAACHHGGWWAKVQGRTACPKCQESWTYLLQCPSCEMKACPRCQAAIRPRRNRGGPRVRIPSPNVGFDDFW